MNFKEKEAAETFINFLCDPEIAGANMDWICYSTPISAAKEYMDPETVADPVSYPSEEILANGSSYAFLPEEIIPEFKNRISITYQGGK